MSGSARKLSEVLPGGFHVGVVGGLFRTEGSKINSFSSDGNFRFPVGSVSPRSLKAGADFSTVGKIGGACSFPEVGDPIVTRVSITMINLPRNRIAINVKPRKAMNKILHAINPHLEVALAVESPGGFAQISAATVRRLDQPEEESGSAIISGYLSQSLLGNRRHSDPSGDQR